MARRFDVSGLSWNRFKGQLRVLEEPSASSHSYFKAPLPLQLPSVAILTAEMAHKKNAQTESHKPSKTGGHRPPLQSTYGALQKKFGASSMLPVPLYLAT